MSKLNTQGEAEKQAVVSSSAYLTESQIEHQIEIDEEEDRYFMDDEDYEDEILGYECMGCGNIQYNQTGFGCDQCMGHSLEPWYG